MNSQAARIAVVGAGLIGKRHIHHVAREAKLASIVDPNPAAQAIADEYSVPHHSTIADMLAAGGAEGAIIATPNQMHEANGIECVQAGLPILVEKPIASTVASAEKLVSAGEKAGVPILVGHHRRHNPLISLAKEQINKGVIGQVQVVHGTCWLFKPDDYFDTTWRLGKGSGPVLINLIHDIDLLRYLCGEIVSVQALKNNRVRGLGVEETAAMLLQFSEGALGTISVSDTVVSPWSWELTSAENPAYPNTNQSCYHLGGTHGSLSLPDLSIWHNKDNRSWWAPISKTSLPRKNENPLALQIEHFSKVALGLVEPIVSGREGLRTLKVIAAILEAAETKTMVEVT